MVCRNDFGFTVLTGRSSPAPLGDGVDTTDDVNWQGAAPTWSVMSIALGQNITQVCMVKCLVQAVVRLFGTLGGTVGRTDMVA